MHEALPYACPSLLAVADAPRVLQCASLSNQWTRRIQLASRLPPLLLLRLRPGQIPLQWLPRLPTFLASTAYGALLANLQLPLMNSLKKFQRWAAANKLQSRVGKTEKGHLLYLAREPSHSSNRRILSSYLMLRCASCRLMLQAKVLGPEDRSGGDWRSSQISALKQRPFSMLTGSTLPEGWRASVKVRITTRRGGRPGRTTTNTYYSPAGKAYRSHGAVLDALRGIEGGTVPGSEAPSDTESVPPSPKRVRH